MGALLKQQGSTGVAEVVQSGGRREARWGQEWLEVVTVNVLAAQGAADAGGEDESVILPDRSCEPFGALAGTVVLECFHRHRREVDGSALASLRSAVVSTFARLPPEATCHTEHTCISVEIRPREPEGFPYAQACREELHCLC